ncbi:NAD(P)H-binding protein [Streptomyces sp. NPDC053755]|uniref:SDR family oxidoreductase n=1 Tax=Streptomyces sp. NPDC053755 TaxID=3155815 RepID=UPI00342D6D87
MIVVTGASGNVGRTLVRVLAGSGREVTAVTRRPADGPLPPGVRHRQADLAHASGLEQVFEGAEALFLLVAGTGEALRPREIAESAAASGVRRIVLLSSQLVGTRPWSPSHRALGEFETAVRESGPRWTVLRPGGFASNAFLWAESVRETRTVAAPFGDVALPVVDPDDIAEVAAAALCEDGHAGRILELTGPAALTPREQTEALARAVGAPLRFVERGRDEARAHMARFLPASAVDGMLDVLGEPSPEERRVSRDVERVLGRPARPFSAWAERNAAAFGPAA